MILEYTPYLRENFFYSSIGTKIKGGDFIDNIIPEKINFYLINNPTTKINVR